MASRRRVAAESERQELKGGTVVGTVETVALDRVKPNPWNPNRMTPRQLESLKHGLKEDGWLTSQSILVWRTDDTGTAKYLIIDGEHRWRAATALGFVEGPMVFLDGVTEAQAKALTIKLDNKRGSFDQEILRGLLREVQEQLGDEPALDLGFEDAAYLALIAAPGSDLDGIDNPPGQSTFEGVIPTMTTQVNMVQIFLTSDQKALWDERVRTLAGRFGTRNATDTVIEAIRLAAEASTAAA
jgi:hypothetical protein